MENGPFFVGSLDKGLEGFNIFPSAKLKEESK